MPACLSWKFLDKCTFNSETENDLIESKKIHCWWPAFDQKHVPRAGMLTVNQTMTMGNHIWLDSMSKGYATVHSRSHQKSAYRLSKSSKTCLIISFRYVCYIHTSKNDSFCDLAILHYLRQVWIHVLSNKIR